MVEQINHLDLVSSFQDAVNRKDINEVLAMFTLMIYAVINEDRTFSG